MTDNTCEFCGREFPTALAAKIHRMSFEAVNEYCTTGKKMPPTPAEALKVLAAEFNDLAAEMDAMKTALQVLEKAEDAS